MVGVGAIGTLEVAQELVASKGVTFTALWSDSRDAWDHYDMDSTSDFMLLDRFGARLTEAAPYESDLVEELLDELF